MLRVVAERIWDACWRLRVWKGEEVLERRAVLTPVPLLTKRPIVIINCVHAVGCRYLRSHGRSSSVARSSWCGEPGGLL